MNTVSVTRMELLACKAKITLARQGRDLLEQKRTSLMKELMRIASTALEHSDALQLAASNARFALARAYAMAGTEEVRSAALASRAELPLEITTISIMGVKVPRIELKRAERSILSRGYSPSGTSTSVDEAADSFRGEVDAIIQLAETELRLSRLASEIQRTSRRLNALDHFLIPRLEAERSFIEVTLDERERADHFRLKRVKRSLERRRGD